jgi:hypothetical protein
LSLESDIGRVTNDVVGAINDTLSSTLSSVLKNEMKLSDDQIRRVVAVSAMTIEGVSYNAVNQYVAVANKYIRDEKHHGIVEVDTSVKKTGLFGR